MSKSTEEFLKWKLGEKYPSVKIREVPYLIKEKRPRRNNPCPCGSGKKFKKCHGKVIIEPTYEKDEEEN